MLTKILGGLSILAGIFFIVLFPDLEDFQPEGFFLTGRIIGIFLFLLGIYLLKI